MAVTCSDIESRPSRMTPRLGTLGRGRKLADINWTSATLIFSSCCRDPSHISCVLSAFRHSRLARIHSLTSTRHAITLFTLNELTSSRQRCSDGGGSRWRNPIRGTSSPRCGLLSLPADRARDFASAYCLRVDRGTTVISAHARHLNFRLLTFYRFTQKLESMKAASFTRISHNVSMHSAVISHEPETDLRFVCTQ